MFAQKNKKKIVLFSIIGQKKQAGQIDDRLPLISLHQESTTTKVLSSKNSWKAEYHQSNEVILSFILLKIRPARTKVKDEQHPKNKQWYQQYGTFDMFSMPKDSANVIFLKNFLCPVSFLIMFCIEDIIVQPFWYSYL